jgi:hypothetical protein
MLSYPPTKSNAERQREFQLRNPGYDARRKARDRASIQRMREMRKAQAQAAMQAQTAAEPSAPPVTIPAAEPVLTLPSPRQDESKTALSALAAAFAEVTARAATRDKRIEAAA